MPYRTGNTERFRSSRARLPRGERGAVFPVVVFSLVLIAGFLGLTTDLMRNVEAVHQLQFAAQSAALYGMSYATAADGSYSLSAGQSAIAARVSGAGTSAWNSAQAGPHSAGSDWRSPVTFSQSDIEFVNNPNPDDPTDFFLRVRARRDCDDALKQFFLPALYAADVFLGGAVPAEAKSVSSYRIVEVIAQPATRIGAGPPPDSPAGTRAADLAGFAALPIAVSVEQFRGFADPASAATSCTVDLVSSVSPDYSGQPAAGHIKGCLVNLAPTGTGGQYYGEGQGDLAIDQLEGLLEYFGAATLQPTVAPGAVERGSRPTCFDPADPAFVSRQSEIAAALSQLPQRYFIVPVVSAPADRFFDEPATVVGFARWRLNQVNVVAGAPQSITFDIGESVPVRNASFANGLGSSASTLAVRLPGPVEPFLPRQVVGSGNGISPRPRGVVLAPALSPRFVGQG